MPYDDAIYGSPALDAGADTNFDVQGDVYDGTPVKVVPPAGAVEQMARPNRQLGAQHHNWLINQFAAILQALHDDGERVEDDLDAFIDTTFPAYQAAVTALLATRKAEWLSRWGISQATNWLKSAPAGIGQAQGGFYVPSKPGRWYICGVNETVLSSKDGQTWTTETGVATAGSGETCVDGCGNEAGEVVVTTDTRYIFKYAIDGTWTKVDAFGVNTNARPCRVVYDSVNSKWILVGSVTPGEPGRLRYSANGTAWSATSYQGWAFSQATFVDIATNGAGTTIACIYGALLPTTTSFVKSTDGGVTYTAVAQITTHALEGGAAERGSLHYSPHENAWYYSIGRVTGISSEVWRSTNDGASWTKMCSLTTAMLHNICPLRDILVATALAHHPLDDLLLYYPVVYSLDQGATWKLSSTVCPGTVASAGGGTCEARDRALITFNQGVFLGFSAGDPTSPSLTLA